MENKACKDCNKVLPVDCFQLIKKGKRQWFSSYCKDCIGVRSLDSYLKRSYGVSFKEKGRMIQEQDNKCGLCNKVFSSKKDAHLDHCHSSGRIRMVLCGSCNMGLGYFKDNPELLRKAASYLEEN